MALVGTKRTFDGLGTVVAAEFARHIDRLIRKDLEYLWVTRDQSIQEWGVVCITIWCIRGASLGLGVSSSIYSSAEHIKT